tara:strand:- start:680 stop:940 length:261 start_codon:yes stop_codon:yes gene_type:complete
MVEGTTEQIVFLIPSLQQAAVQVLGITVLAHIVIKAGMMAALAVAAVVKELMDKAMMVGQVQTAKVVVVLVAQHLAAMAVRVLRIA